MIRYPITPIMKELEDYPWFPSFLRVQQMDFIGWLPVAFGLYEPLVPMVRALLRGNSATMITDLCSGSGRPAEALAASLGVDCRLTDLYPSASAELLDVLHLGLDQPEGVLTMFNAFHHFNKEQQQSILDQIASLQQPGGHRSPCMLVELLHPGLLDYIKIFVTCTVGQLLLAPFVRPFRWSRLLLTYLLPVNLLTITFDGLVSVGRSMPLQYYQDLCREATTAEYGFDAQHTRTRWFTTLTVITGKSLA